MVAVKLLVAALAFTAFCVAVLLFIKKMGSKSKDVPKETQQKPMTPSATAPGAVTAGKEPAEEMSTQDIIPVADVRGPVLVQTDGTCVSYVKVECENYSMMNREELVSAAEATATVFASQSMPFKVIRMQVPVDSTAYVEEMKVIDARHAAAALSSGMTREGQKARERAEVRRGLLSHYIREAEREAKSASKCRTEIYIALPVPAGDGAEDQAEARAVDLVKCMRHEDMSARVLYSREILSLVLDYEGDYRTTSENSSPYAITPLVRGMHDGCDERGFENEEDCYAA